MSSSSYRPQYSYGSPNIADKQEMPFFGKEFVSPHTQPGKTPFFQTKLSVGQPGDRYEQEADAVANKVVQQKSTGPVVQQKEISSIQRLASSKEEEKLGTNEERMRRDKEIQTKPEIQRKCAACEKEEESTVQKKEGGGPTAAASSALSNQISSSAGKGQALPKGTLGEMQSSFGADFSNVNIHTGSDAVQMNKELGAQAFTHGSDIYFNSGKYNPGTSEGRHLLAHELTHVVQQGAASEKGSIQRSCHDGACDSCAGGVRDFWITFYFRRRATRRTMTYLRQQINEAKTTLAKCCLRLKADFNWSLLPGGGRFDPLVQDATGAWRYSDDARTLGTDTTFRGARGIPVLVVDEVDDSGGGVTVTTTQTFDRAYAGRVYAVIGVNQPNPNTACSHLAHELWHVGSGEGHDPAHGSLAACQGNDVSPEFCSGLRNVVAPVGDFPTTTTNGDTAVA